MIDQQVPMPVPLPQTDEPKKKPRVNNLQENLLWLMNKKKISLADIQRETMIPWGTLYSWFKNDVESQLLDINVKELASYLEVSIDELAFSDLRNEDINNKSA